MLQQEGDYFVGQNAHGGGRYTRAPAQQQQQGYGGFPFWLPSMGLGNFYTPYGPGDAQNVPNPTLGANFLGQQPNLQSLYGQPMGQVPGQKQQTPTSGVGNPLIAGKPPTPSPNGWAGGWMTGNPNYPYPWLQGSGGNQSPSPAITPSQVPTAGQSQKLAPPSEWANMWMTNNPAMSLAPQAGSTQKGTQQYPTWANMPYLKNPAMRPRPFMGS